VSLYDEEDAGSDPLDLYLGLFLKNWLAQQSPPAGVEARLLQAASFTTPTVRRRNMDLALALIYAFLHAFRRAFVALFLHPVKQPIMYSFPAKRRFSYSGSYDLSQLLARNALLQSLPTGTGILCLIS